MTVCVTLGISQDFGVKTAEQRKYSSLFETLDIDKDGYIIAEEFALGWSSPSAQDTFEQDDRQVSLVWNDETWIDERTGNPSTLTGKS